MYQGISNVLEQEYVQYIGELQKCLYFLHLSVTVISRYLTAHIFNTNLL